MSSTYLSLLQVRVQTLSAFIHGFNSDAEEVQHRWGNENCLPKRYIYFIIKTVILGRRPSLARQTENIVNLLQSQLS